MGNVKQQIAGKFAQLHLQMGSTAVAGPTSLTGNATTENLDGRLFDAYMVFTLPAGPVITDPGVTPTLAFGGTGLPASYTFEIDPLRGKVILNAPGTASSTIQMSNYATPKLVQIAKTGNFDLTVSQGVTDATSHGSAWEHRLRTFSSWEGSLDGSYQVNSLLEPDLWPFGDQNSATVDVPVVMKMYPHRAIGTEFFVGMGFFTFSVRAPKDGVVSWTSNVHGDGPLVFRSS